MLNFRNAGRLVTASVLLVAFVLMSGSVQARPNYMGVFKKAYPKLAKSKEVKVNCSLCHNSKENRKKKHRNDYGVAMKEALDKKKESDKKKIAEVLKKIEAKKSHVEGKTFLDLINDGKLPGEDKAAD